MGDPQENLRRIGRAVKATEKRRVYRGAESRPRWSEPPNQVRTAIVSVTITARSGTTLGVGKVKLCLTDVDAGTETVSTDTLDEFTVYNSFAVAFTSHATKRVKFHREGGLWKVLSREC